ncbi:COG1361 S-layer family protein, partial [Methanoregula sp.]|uniref:COG1361 S-layer family protein n=1 Tax=Methanoregula sp. TaxID=2052170 RepID=UPI003BB0998E
AYIAGTNEYLAGGDIQIPVVIENNGLSLNVQVAPDIIDRADAPTTAKFVTVAMEAGDAPLVIKSDPQMIGDIASQARATVTFAAKVNADAPAGTYAVPLNISYTRFSTVDQYGVDTLRYYYVQDNVTVTVPLVIKPEVIPEVVSATSNQLIAGADGYLNLTIKNIGSLDGAKATVHILQDDDSPVSPVDSSVYIGDFPAGSNVSCQYKVTVAKDAENKIYPVDVVVVYQNNEGDFVTSQTETVGVDVGNKVDFEILSPPAEMNPGSKRTIQVEYENTGNSTIRSAEARLSIVDPFTSTSDTAYLGDLAPGQSAVASFQISVASDATLKEYGLDSEIRYRDALDDTYISDPMKVSIDVENLTGFAAIVSNPVYLSVLIAAIIGGIYAVYSFRKKR